MKPYTASIITSGGYDPRDKMADLIIGTNGPCFTIGGLTHADLIQIKSVVDILVEESKPPRKRKSK